MNINDRLIKLITSKESVGRSESAGRSESINEEEDRRFLKRGMEIYELFGVIPIMKICKLVIIRGENRSSCDPYNLHLHYDEEKCYHDNRAVCKYLHDLYRINGGGGDGGGDGDSDSHTVLDQRLQDLASEVYCDWKNINLGVSIELVTYPDTWYEDYDKHIFYNHCVYIVLLIPNKVKMLINKVCEELEYLPPNHLLPLGGIKYQQGKASFELARFKG